MRAARLVLGIISVLIVMAVAVVAAYAWGSASGKPIKEETTSRTSEIITAVEREEEIVLLSTATQGLHTVEREAKIFKWEMPGSRRTNILQYTFTAQLGIDGGDVAIRQTDTDSYLVTVPPFKSIGFKDPEFKTVHRDGRALSFITEEIDSAEAVTEILNDEKRQEHIDANRDLLEDQARNFYTGIIHAIDEDLQLQFEFR